MTKLSVSVGPQSFAQAKCGSVCLKYDCQMYREDGNGTCTVAIIRNMCDGEVITDELPGDRVEVFERKMNNYGKNMCLYKGFYTISSQPLTCK